MKTHFMRSSLLVSVTEDERFVREGSDLATAVNLSVSEAALCTTVLENLGDVDPTRVAVSVSPSSLVERGGHTPIHVTVSYRQPISSPLLRVFLGETFIATGDAWSQ